MKRTIFGMVLACAVAGCSAIDDVPADARLAAACRAYAATLTTLATVKPEMSSGQIAVVDSAVAVAGPLCRNGEFVASTASALATVTGAVRDLATVEQEVKS